jgi:phospholipase/carboxylesterase
MTYTTDRDTSALIDEPSSGLSYRVRDARTDTSAKARLLLLHGVGSNETNLEAVATSVDPRVQVVLVRGPLRFATSQYGWFEVNFQTGVPSIDAQQAEKSRQQLITLVRALRAQDGANPARTVIAGFSQGGILSASVGLSAPDDVAGFAILSGRILPELEPHIAPREALTKLSAFIAHGRFDNKLPIEWAERADHWLTALGVPHRTARYPMGHELNTDVVADFNQWLIEPLLLA